MKKARDEVADEVRRWKPRRRGDVYCAPACGRGCKRAWYEDAVAQAKKLCKRLGPGWTPQVWENLGWHYSAVSPCGRLKVHASKRWHEKTKRYVVDGYTAFLGEAGSPGGKWAEHGKTPFAAIKATVEKGREELLAVAELVGGVPVPAG